MTQPELRAWQATALTQWRERSGLLVVAGVGSGKTLVGARVASTGARPVVVLPAAVRKQTERMYAEYGVTDVRFLSYTELTRADRSTLLEQLRPDVLVLDEAHLIKRVLTNSAAKRIQRYLVANPAVRVCVLSASLITDRVTDFCHLAHWALRGAVRSLVPQTRSGAEQLQERLDADPAARAEFMRRLMSTPGVVDQTADAEYHGRVVVRVIRRESALTLPADWSLPDGYFLTSPTQAAEVSKMMAWGYWPKVTPRPSEVYLDARRSWNHTVRSVIATGACDTEFQVRALRPEAFATYEAAEDAEPVGTETPVWETDAAINWVRDYLWQSMNLSKYDSGGPWPKDLAAGCGPSIVVGTDGCGMASDTYRPTDSPGSCTTAQFRAALKCAITATYRGVSTPTTCSSAPTSITCATPRQKVSCALDQPPGPGEAATRLRWSASASADTQTLDGRTDVSGCEMSEPYSGLRILVWVFHVALGERLSTVLGIPYHRSRGLDADGTRLDEARCPVAIASISACAAGLNLQYFNANLWLECVADPETLRQGFGRTSRQGQIAGQVTHDVVVAGESNESALRTAIARAKLSGKANPILQLDGTDW